jgi:hypothetical protein
MSAVSKSESSDARSIVSDDEFRGFRIVIPPSRTAWVVFACGVAIWVMIMAFELSSIRSAPGRARGEGITSLVVTGAIGLGLGSLTAAAALRRDTVIIEGKSLLLRKEFATFRKERAFELGEIRNLRPALVDSPSGNRHRPSSVAFDYKGETYQFGCALSEPEVMRLIKTIRTRFPIRDDWNEAEPLPVIR